MSKKKPALAKKTPHIWRLRPAPWPLYECSRCDAVSPTNEGGKCSRVRWTA